MAGLADTRVGKSPPPSSARVTITGMTDALDTLARGLTGAAPPIPNLAGSPSLLARLRRLARLAGSWLNAFRPPRELCRLCTTYSRNHPTGGVRRYTRNRIAGLPVCDRHSLAEFHTWLLNTEQDGKHP